ncbi:MAG: hypothetical protein NHB32_08440 [Fischerella sp. CENA71]|nr:hypothetical protein [Fischerella sp. CENA71]
MQKYNESIHCDTDTGMTKRTTVVLPDEVYEALLGWAEEEGRPTANLTAFILEAAVRFKYPDKFPILPKKFRGEDQP